MNLGDLDNEQGSLNPAGLQMPGGSPGDNQFRKRLWLALAVLAVLIVIVGLALLAGHKPSNGPGANKKGPGASASPSPAALATTTTQPDVSQISMMTQALVVQFTEPLTQGSAQITSSPKLVSGSSISGNALTINFTPKTLQLTKTYTITINSISSTTGQKLTNKQFTFTPQPGQPASSGQSDLLNIGLSNDQTNAVFDDMSNFDPWAQEITLDPSTLKHYKLNPSDAWSPWAVSFTVSIDNTNYFVVGDYYDTQNIEVKIYDPSTNKQLYSAGNPGSI